MGRPQGAVTRKTRELREKALAARITPLEFLMQQMLDEDNDLLVRIDCGKSLMPYVHARIAPVDSKGNTANDMVIQIIRFSEVNNVIDGTPAGHLRPNQIVGHAVEVRHVMGDEAEDE